MDLKHLNKKKLNYIGYGGYGNRSRCSSHTYLCELIILLKNLTKYIQITIGGSKKSYTSLINLTKLCQNITGNKIKIGKIKKTSIYDIPYYISDNKVVTKTYKWKPKRDIYKVVNDTFLWLKNNKLNIKKYF